MIRVVDLSLYFGDRALLDSLNISINHGEKVALTGRNGSGKSTLFKILTRQLSPTKGQIEYPKNYTLGLLKQELPEDKGYTVREDVKLSLEEIAALQNEEESIIQKFNEVHHESSEFMDLLERQSYIHDRLVYLQIDKVDGEIERILSGLGFKSTDFDRKCSEFSGGWRMRIELAKLLLSKPDVIMLDEPNNHLDIVSIQWLEKYLKNYEGTVILITHDLQFMDAIAKRIIEIDRGRVMDYVGNYSAFKAYRAERVEIETNEFKSQQKMIQHKEMLIDKFRAKASKASFSKSLQKELDRLDVKELPDVDTSSIRLRFQPSRQSGRKVLEVKDLVKQYGELLVLDHVDAYVERGMKISFVGANGNGKSTMVKLICNEIKPEHGLIELGHEVKIAYFAQEHQNILNMQKTVFETVEDAALPEMRTNVRRILGGLGLQGDDIDKRIGVLSGGEKSRVRLAMLLVQDHNLLILDEPTHHLDMMYKDSLKEAIKNYTGTVIIVSHDREFLRDLAEKTYSFESKKIKVYEGDIDYFLSKKSEEESANIDLLKQEKNKSIQIQPTVSTIKNSNPELKKKLQRNLQNVEKEISKLDEKIKEIEALMIDPQFFNSNEGKTKLKDYEQIKSNHALKSNEWENLFLQLEEL
ncbi:MAG: ABC-F family ATP-binding cassette domain-containing protein [Saprospiraceae bacterium]|nr:ABC-F family ATP-binding cassette domain-containing protein [Saprospiraceae bacterium]